MTVWATAKVFTYLESRFKGLHSCSSYLLHSQLARPPRSKTSAVPRHLYCPFHPVLSRSGDFLKCSAQNYSKSQKSKFQIDLTATVFELDTRTWGAKVFIICPGSLPQSLEQIWWLFEKVKKCSTLMLSTFSSHGHSFWATAKTWGAKIFFICPATLPQNLEQIWWLFEKVKKCSTLMLSTFSRNLAKSQKSKFQIDLTATVFELDSSCWASSPLYMPRLPSTKFGADLVTFWKMSKSVPL